MSRLDIKDLEVPRQIQRRAWRRRILRAGGVFTLVGFLLVLAAFGAGYSYAGQGADRQSVQSLARHVESDVSQAQREASLEALKHSAREAIRVLRDIRERGGALSPSADIYLKQLEDFLRVARPTEHLPEAPDSGR